jgi:hypothetical protein
MQVQWQGSLEETALHLPGTNAGQRPAVHYQIATLSRYIFREDMDSFFPLAIIFGLPNRHYWRYIIPGKGLSLFPPALAMSIGSDYV